MSRESLGFEVDTQLFRELGELLVGRDSTALAELVKNSYDADATAVQVYGEGLGSSNRGTITVKDNGVGMTEREFRSGFLKIASRSKGEPKNRISPLHNRRVTGEKGIGRLAAHKLASRLELESLPHPSKNQTMGIRASIDWGAIEQLANLSDVATSGAVSIETIPLPTGYEPGTTITLTQLRKPWTDADIRRFSRDMNGYQLPNELLMDPEKAIGCPSILGLLLEERFHPETSFSIELMGEFDTGEAYATSELGLADWVIEVESTQDQTSFLVAQVPTKAERGVAPYERRFTVKHPNGRATPRFNARVYYKKGKSRAWKVPGIAMYMEGFRVFPYGEPGNDWLDVDKRYNERTKALTLPSVLGGKASTEHFTRNPSKQFFGGVFVQSDSGSDLKMVVNREGFVANDSFSALCDALKSAIELFVRARSEIHVKEEKEKKHLASGSGGAPRSGSSDDPLDAPASPPLQLIAEQTINAAAEAATRAREDLASGDIPGASEALSAALNQIQEGLRLSEELMSEHRLVNVLAGVGTQLSGFTHDVRQLMAELNVVDQVLGDISHSRELPDAFRTRLNTAISRVGDARRLVESQALFLADVVSNDSRRRRSRQRLREVFEGAISFLGGPASRALIAIQNEIPAGLETPPMFKAELSVVLTNLLSNAIKAAGEGGRIWAHSEKQDEHILLVIENSGTSVNLEHSENLFEPFVSTSNEVDSELGQGMGLGLSIVRTLLAGNEATVKFVQPSKGFSTAVQVTWRRR